MTPPAPDRSPVDDRRRGALLGLAIGDALGAAVEFSDRGSFAPVTGYRGGGPHWLAGGEWTDDTSMALALADSIGHAGWDLRDQMLRYVDWWRNGRYSVIGRCFDIGNTTADSLASFMRNPRRTDPAAWSDPSEVGSGNGSIMRLAPVPIKYHDLYPDHIAELATLADDSGRTTHASPQCRSACRYLAVVQAALINGEAPSHVLSPHWPALTELQNLPAAPLHPKILAVALGSYKIKSEHAISGSGWVVQSLEAALWAFHNATSFEEAVLKAVNLGLDADSTGAVCGQLCGAYWGESGIPAALLDGLARKDMIEDALASLMA